MESTLAEGDEFSKATKDLLAQQVGQLCSFPGCRRPTGGPRVGGGAASVGVAAHITGARPNSARYDATLTSEQRKSHENGIWMCQTHARLIDADYPADDGAPAFSVELLLKWKADALADQRRRLEHGDPAEQWIAITNSPGAIATVNQVGHNVVINTNNPARRATGCRIRPWRRADGLLLVEVQPVSGRLARWVVGALVEYPFTPFTGPPGMPQLLDGGLGGPAFSSSGEIRGRQYRFEGGAKPVLDSQLSAYLAFDGLERLPDHVFVGTFDGELQITGHLAAVTKLPRT